MPFEEYVIDMGVRDFKFLVGTQEGKDWYDPIKPYTKLEYEWVLENVDLNSQHVLDCGAHHGHYAIILAQGSSLICVDPFYHNMLMVQENMKLNGLECGFYYGAVAKRQGMRAFEYRSNGRFNPAVDTEVECSPIYKIYPNADVVKLDVEGAEFEIIPQAIEKMKSCKTWIVEIHPNAGHPDMITTEFEKNGFELLKVNREKMIVEPYQHDIWRSHATVIARRA